MISSSLSPIIFHILFTSTFGSIDIKILQINEPASYLCDLKKCDLNQENDDYNVTSFVKQNDPDVILWFSNFKSNRTIFYKFKNQINTFLPKTYVIPVYGNNHSRTNCFNSSEECYSVHHVPSQGISFVILDTDLWLNSIISPLASRQMQWLESTLMMFKSDNKKVIIVGYDPPGFLETSSDSTKYDQTYNNMFVNLLHKYSTAVSICIFGSKHTDSFRIVFNGHGKPAIAIFISSTMSTDTLPSISNLRIYTYNVVKLSVENYVQFQRTTGKVAWTNKYNFKNVYGIENVHVNSLYNITQSFSGNAADQFKIYSKYQLKNESFRLNCSAADDRLSCVKCHSSCFILNLLTENLNDCLKKCRLRAGKNLLFVVGVIVGFVFILVCIVFAVNKVYCFRRSRQGNLFLAPLTLDVQADIIDDIIGPNFNGKLSLSRESIDNNQTPKTSNGHKRSSNHETEQTYDYIRM